MLLKGKAHDREILNITNAEVKWRINYLKLTIPKI